MIEYVVQSGPLRGFDGIFDNRFDKLKHVADFHTIQITGKPTTQRIHIAKLSRSSERELAFVSTFFASVAAGHGAVFTMRDAASSRASELVKKLNRQDELRLAGEPQLTYHYHKYGTAEDDLVLVSLANFTTDFQFLAGCVPPVEGVMAFYLTSSPYDLFDIHWQRACRDSEKAKDDRIRRDSLSIANQAQVTFFMDSDGSYSVILNPKVTDVEAIEGKITTAGEKAGMKITFGPSLFS